MSDCAGEHASSLGRQSARAEARGLLSLLSSGSTVEELRDLIAVPPRTERMLRAFAKLPQIFGFSIEYTDAAMNLKSYFPDFVAVDDAGTHWLLEAKGQENIDVIRKDAAALRWCENASKLTETPWRYIKVPQKDYEALRPQCLADLAALQPASLF